MEQLLPLPWFLRRKQSSWRWRARESLLAVGSIFLATLIMYICQLPQHLPDTLLLYILVILVLAAFRSFYTACLASVLAFFSFDLFFVPPFYSFQASKFEDILSLLAFLFSALLASYLASALHRQIEHSQQKEREARLLYQLAQTSNRQETLEKQLSLFSRYLVEVFQPLGLLQCTFLLLDAQQQLVSVPAQTNQQTFAPPDEYYALNWVREQGRSLVLHEPIRQIPVPRTLPLVARFFREERRPIRSYIQLIPLQVNQQVKGILRLHVLINSRGEHFWSTIGLSTSASHLFFATLLEHASTIIQQEQVRQERMQLQIYQQTEKLRSALVTSVSHDLRKPLTTIKAAATSLRIQRTITDQDLEPGGLISAIEYEAEWLDGLIENLLDMSRIESGVLRPQKTWYAFDILLQDVLLRLRPAIGSRRVQLTLPPDITPIPIDVVLIEQVLTNLLNNALSYTPADSPLDIQVRNEVAALEVRILDRGPGIPEREREQIFEKFYRLTTPSGGQQQSGGMGLGLAICRGIIEAHAGRIWVEARPGGGAIFVFTLPLPAFEGGSIDDQEDTHFDC
ncbi:sensor histidine kinase [Dictyobacter formicarum]|uniref:histidine kinase n=1 Tax=Dictyobacter formicarum TaxID=2778368 RepID=A0ABQ3VTM1_9CHLR|nr:ATP-binding protein [Dictyobacter formicarum]GHO88661.1 hypothetical protein KSZ_66670 [Dictyobacter formicarum]